jgi:hypothetical protein
MTVQNGTVCRPVQKETARTLKNIQNGKIAVAKERYGWEQWTVGPSYFGKAPGSSAQSEVNRPWLQASSKTGATRARHMDSQLKQAMLGFMETAAAKLAS